MDEIHEFIAYSNCAALSKHDIGRKLRIIEKRQADAKALIEAELKAKADAELAAQQAKEQKDE